MLNDALQESSRHLEYDADKILHSASSIPNPPNLQQWARFPTLRIALLLSL